jgi:hypothetical protein
MNVRATATSVLENGQQTNTVNSIEETGSLFSFMSGFTLNSSDSAMHPGKGFCSCEADGPFSSESSVPMSITLFLGGVGNIGMSHGVVCVSLHTRIRSS